MKLLIASDHAGLRLKTQIIDLLPNYQWKDLGTNSETSVDYPDFARLLCEAIQNGDAQEGILICGSGIGVSIAANRFQGIRAALVENPVSARFSRKHNHANVLCLGSRFLAPEYAIEIIQVWLSTEFSQDPRHLKRIEKLS